MIEISINKQVKNQVDDQANEQVWNKMWIKSRVQIGYQSIEKIRSQIMLPVENQIIFQVKRSVSGKLGGHFNGGIYWMVES